MVQAVAQQTVDLMKNMAKDRTKLLKGLGLMVFIIVTAYMIAPGVHAAVTSYRSYNDTKSDYAAKEKIANSIPNQIAALKEATDQFDELSKSFSLDMGTGTALADIAEYCKDNGVELISLRPGDTVKKIYEGHLRAVPVKMEIAGPFPAVLKTMKAIESAGNPSEVRDVKISEGKGDTAKNPGDVSAELTVVLYSLNPPRSMDYVTAPSGNYDPFWALKAPPANPVINPQATTGAQDSALPPVNQVLPGVNNQTAKQPAQQQVQVPVQQPVQNQKQSQLPLQNQEQPQLPPR